VKHPGWIIFGIVLFALLAVIIVGQPMRYDMSSTPTPTPSCDVAPQCDLTLLTTPTPLPSTPTLAPTVPPPHYATQAPVCTTRKLSDTLSIKFCD
jgi:hypothetical protein